MTVCSRCGNEPQVKTRGELFCNECYVSFLNIKFRKHLDIFRVNFMATSIPKLLVPVSFGLGSLALADMLGELLARQRANHAGRIGFTVQCVYIGDDPLEWPFGEDLPLIHIPKAQVFNKAFKIDGEPLSDTSVNGLSRSSLQDLDSQLRGRLIADMAGKYRSVIMGYSMTRLSELVISETVKGRGAGIPELTAPSTKDRIYPLQDILDDELVKYMDIRGLSKYIRPAAPVPQVTKLQSIDELVHRYFVDVQKDFPAVVSTVAKTAAKLAQDPEDCSVCGDGNGVCYGCKVMLKSRSGEKHVERLSTDEILAEYLLE